MTDGIIDERTLAGWLGGPTEVRAAAILEVGGSPLILRADVEEHVIDPDTGRTKRCDVTLRGADGALVTCEMKRPEVAQVDDPDLIEDARKKALARGLTFFLTCNFREIALWKTEQPTRPELRRFLAPELRHSREARSYRDELTEAWKSLLEQLEEIFREEAERRARRQRQLPPQVDELASAVRRAGREATLRLATKLREDEVFRRAVVAEFAEQFGVDVLLDPDGVAARWDYEVQSVANISCFVVATRIILYGALSNEFGNLDPLELTRTSTDPGRIRAELASTYQHARERTGDFELQLTPTFLDEVAFAPSGMPGPVGRVWGELLDVVTRSDWTGPSEYVPALYESLLDEDHRHTMGVHYTPEEVVEVISGYAIIASTDVVLDPAAGAGTFASMAYDRKRALGSTHEQALNEIYAVEIADFAASLTGLSLSLAESDSAASYPRVVYSDFFDLRPGGRTGVTLPTTSGELLLPDEVDAVIGNPPYVRFELRSPEDRAKVAQVLAFDHAHYGLRFPNFTGKADLFTFFMAHATAFLRTGGRLGFIVSWSALSTNYGDALLSFLARYYHIDIVLDTKVERFFAAKTNTVIILARKAEAPGPVPSSPGNPNISGDEPVRFVRLKRPLEELLADAPRGQRGEDLVDSILAIREDVDEDLRWDVRVVPHADLWARVEELGEENSAG